ncbi:MAG TPA: hypothetical protein VGL81_22215 [Polyangiaceae bacterium]|jgi:hypothetical protein
MAHGQWTEVEARGVLEAWKRSGLSVEKYARSRGLVPQRLHWWKQKLRFDADKTRAMSRRAGFDARHLRLLAARADRLAATAVDANFRNTDRQQRHPRSTRRRGASAGRPKPKLQL